MLIGYQFRSLHPKIYVFLGKTFFFRGINVGGNHLWQLAGQYFSQKNKQEWTAELSVLNEQFMVGRFGMEMWMMIWNGCKMGIVPWPDWTNNCSQEGQGGQQEQEAVATIVWSMWIRIHKLNRSGNPALAGLLQHLPCGEMCVVHLLQTYSAKLLENYLFEVVSWVLKKSFKHKIINTKTTSVVNTKCKQNIDKLQLLVSDAMTVNGVWLLPSGSVVKMYILQFFLSLRLERGMRNFTKNLSKLNDGYA